MEGVPEPETLPVPLQGGDAGQAQGGPHPHTTPFPPTAIKPWATQSLDCLFQVESFISDCR